MKKILLIILLSIFMGCSSTKTVTTKEKNRYTDKEEYFLLRGENYSLTKMYPEAIGEFEQALSKNSNNILTLLGLGFAHGELGQLDTAIGYYKKALLLEKNNIVAIKNLAYLYYKKKDFMTAESYLNSLPNNLEDPFVFKLKAYILVEKKQYKEAYTPLANAILTTPYFDEELYRNAVITLRGIGDTDRLFAFLNNTYPKFRNEKGYILFYANTLNRNKTELQDSEKVLKRFMVENFKDDQLLLTLAYNNYDQGEFKNSREVLNLVSPKSHYTEEYLDLKGKLRVSSQYQQPSQVKPIQKQQPKPTQKKQTTKQQTTKQIKKS